MESLRIFLYSTIEALDWCFFIQLILMEHLKIYFTKIVQLVLKRGAFDTNLFSIKVKKLN